MPLQAIVPPSLASLTFISTPIPTPTPHQVVIKVLVAGSNPADWKIPAMKNQAINSGHDLAGIVHSVGSAVYEFKPGDRVAAFHETFTENGAYAEYAVAPDWTTFHVPESVSLEEAVTVPVAALTAAVAMFSDLGLRSPWDVVEGESREKLPFLIYGVGSAVGSFAAKLARLAGLGPVIGVAGRASVYAETLVDYVVDYRQGEDALVAAVERVLENEGLGNKVPYVFDAVSENGSLEATLRFIDPKGGKVSTVLPPKLFAKDKENYSYPAGVTGINSILPVIHSTKKEFGYIWSRYLGRLLADGRLKAHPYEVVSGGLKCVLTGLQNLKDGKASAMKYVYRIEDTGDVEIDKGGE
ncbi:groes-like alcohol dehydrogenase [Massarina eburnea CBS 473.64]|uniref:Groes-like alcohol dehydrogenase n=1 Tax=Massarina eburnea CBS 473.64 TaxID=1395130 RepID=A0A6A6RS45_9PLEO|nr:groes-like alcohol dehydrogenase [Massarina eburnea CBS 473.64]